MATFGHETIAPYISMLCSEIDGEIINGCLFTITEDGIADSITAAIKSRLTSSTNYTRYAIYKHSDLSFVGETEELFIPFTTTFAWYPLNFIAPKPELTANTEYILVAWVKWVLRSIHIAIEVWTTGINTHHNQHIDYNSFPDPFAPTYHGNQITSIYCTYTPIVVAKPPISNIIPLMKGMDLIGMVKPFSKRFPKLSPLVIR